MSGSETRPAWATKLAGSPVTCWKMPAALLGLAVGMRASDVIFTSGATEANNLAFTGLRRGIGRPIRILVGATEHKSVLQTCRALEEDGLHTGYYTRQE